MISRVLAPIFCAALLSLPQAALAVEQLDAHQNWGVYVGEDDGKVCFIATAPIKEDAEAPSSRREAFLMVSWRPSLKTEDVVSLRAGYALNEHRIHRVLIGEEKFEMLAEGEGAWLETGNEEKAMVRAMRKGKDAEVVTIASSGEEVSETYSLLGFTAAYNRASKECR